MKIVANCTDGARHLPVIAGGDESRAFLLTLSFLRGLDDKLEALHYSRMMGMIL